jgi:hypothetical protein
MRKVPKQNEKKTGYGNLPHHMIVLHPEKED